MEAGAQARGGRDEPIREQLPTVGRLILIRAGVLTAQRLQGQQQAAAVQQQLLQQGLVAVEAERS